MVEAGMDLSKRLLKLTQETGYPIVQHNGQRKFGPPPSWTGPPPERGSEVFVGKLPREIFEDELVHVFATVGKIYEMRLMMDFSGSNRGYAFVTYSNKAEASKAVNQLNGFQIKPGRHIGVVKSVDNCRLFVGCIPKTKNKEEIREELEKRVSGIVDVILYKNCFDRSQNRGFAFVEFVSHRAAAMARRVLVPGCVRLWDRDVTVDWAEPEPEFDDEQMKSVKVLYVRNFLIKTIPDAIKEVFENAISHKIERVKKIRDYAFVHFHKREHAELAMQKLQNAEIDGINMEIKWAKPVERELYRIQKQSRGNAKFNRSFNLSQTMWLYKQHKDKREYASSPKEDEGIGSLSGSPTSVKTWLYQPSSHKDLYTLPPAKLEALCKKYMWAPPVYDYQKYMDPVGSEMWVGKVELPQVGPPLLSAPMSIGPLGTGVCSSLQQANVEAAAAALTVIQNIQSMRSGYVKQTSPTPIQPMYPSIMPSMPMPVPYMAPIGPSMCSRQLPMPMHTIWRSA